MRKSPLKELAKMSPGPKVVRKSQYWLFRLPFKKGGVWGYGKTNIGGEDFGVGQESDTWFGGRV